MEGGRQVWRAAVSLCDWFDWVFGAAAALRRYVHAPAPGTLPPCPLRSLLFLWRQSLFHLEVGLEELVADRRKVALEEDVAVGLYCVYVCIICCCVVCGVRLMQGL